MELWKERWHLRQLSQKRTPPEEVARMALSHKRTYRRACERLYVLFAEYSRESVYRTLEEAEPGYAEYLREASYYEALLRVVWGYSDYDLGNL